MMYHFKLTELQQLEQHALTGTHHRPDFDQLFDPAYKDAAGIDTRLIPPALWLIGDGNVYIVTNTQAPDPFVANARDPAGCRFYHYLPAGLFADLIGTTCTISVNPTGDMMEIRVDTCPVW